MSGHRRVKDVAYDEDDVDEYGDKGYIEETLGLTHEDEAQMRQGVEAVRQVLGTDSAIENKEVEEALWYYYYDIPKTIAYLLKKHAPPEPKKQKQPSKFEQAAKVAQSKTIPSNNAEFFKDTPWFKVPQERRGIICIEPLFPHGGLLGGSPAATSDKPSKLAALAASRKKAQEEKRKAVEQDAENPGLERQEQTKSLALLDRLTTRKPQEQEIASGRKLESMGEVSGFTASSERLQQRPYPRRETPNVESTPLRVSPSAGKELSREEKQGQSVDELIALPSMFAITMLGDCKKPAPAHMTEDNILTLLYRGTPNITDNPFAGPSPDDVVASAQSKGTKSNKANAKKMNANVSNVAEGVTALNLEDAPKTKNKYLDVLAEFERSKAKNAANFIVIGHVDHGKSTLMGRLLYDLKLVNQRSVDKLRAEATSIGKASFALAWVMDSTAEERQRGVTVDIATNYFETHRTRFTILDAPGHRDFIPNMLAGAAQADFAVLVIDASVNAFEAGLRGQTKEHALLVRSMGIARVIVAVNKMDAAKWSQGRFIEISQQMSAFLTAAGFQPKNLAYVPCAGLTGENVVTKPPDGIAPWYAGRTLVEELDASDPTIRALTDPLRVTISDTFRGGVQNPLSVSGRLDAGSLQTGDIILAMPAGETATVKGIEVDGTAADWAVAGQIATLHLSDIEPVHLRPGDIICSATNKPIRNAKAFTTKILAFEHLTPGWVDVHRGRLHTPAKVMQLLATLEKSSGAVEKKKPRVVKPGTVARVRVELEKALPLEVAGRVVLRSEGTTLAAGLVESVE